MASGLGEFLQSLRKGLVISEQTTPKQAHSGENARGKGPRRRRDHDTPESAPSLPEPRKTLPVSKQYAKDQLENYLEKLPSEIVLKILSFLDASSLFNISFVNKRFHDLANNKYASETEKKWRPRVSGMTEAASSSSVEEKPAGYWKKMLLKEMAGYKDTKWKTELKHKNPHTGMPVLTEEVIRRLCIQWEIILTFRTGRESIYKQTHTFFEEASVMVYWSHGTWPLLLQLVSLKLHGIASPFVPAPGDKPRWRSLLFKTSLDRDVHWSFLGADRLVKCMQFGKVVVGVWRGDWRIAFVLVSLHFHKLIERSLLGSRLCPYMPAENIAVDPDCSRHGYTLHIVLHNPLRRIMCQRFSPLYTSRCGPQGEYLQLNAINFSDVSEHMHVPKISLPWQAEGLQGDVEAQRPFWCVSSPVRMSINLRVVEVEYEGEQFVILYEDAEGRVRMTLVWMEEFQHYFLVQLSVAFPAAKVKRHFGRE